MVEQTGAPTMQKWEISFVWRPPQSRPGTARREVREARYLVTRHGGSRFQTVGGGLSWRGQCGVCILSWGGRDSLRQTQDLFSWRRRGKLGSGQCVDVKTCEIILSRCIYMYNHSERGAFYMVRNLTWRPHTCVKPLLCTFLSTFVYFFFDSIVIPHLLFLDGDRGDRRVPGTCWYGCDTWEPLSNTASCCHDDELTDHGAMQANAFHSGMRHY